MLSEFALTILIIERIEPCKVEKSFKEKRRNGSCLKGGFLIFDIWTTWKEWLFGIYIMEPFDGTLFLIRRCTVIDMFLSTLHITKFTWLTLSLAFMCSWWRIFGLFMFSSFNFYNFFFLFKIWLFDVYYLNCTEIVILRKFVYLLLFLFSCFSVYLLFSVCGFYAITCLLFCFGLGFFIFYWILM